MDDCFGFSPLKNNCQPSHLSATFAIVSVDRYHVIIVEFFRRRRIHHGMIFHDLLRFDGREFDKERIALP